MILLKVKNLRLVGGVQLLTIWLNDAMRSRRGSDLFQAPGSCISSVIVSWVDVGFAYNTMTCCEAIDVENTIHAWKQFRCKRWLTSSQARNRNEPVDNST